MLYQSAIIIPVFCMWVQLDPSDADLQKRANIGAIRDWHETASRDAKRAFPSKQWDPTLLKRQGKWLDAPEMYQVAELELQSGAPSNPYNASDPIHAPVYVIGH